MRFLFTLSAFPAVGDDEVKKSEGKQVEGIFGFGKKDKDKEKSKEKSKDKVNMFIHNNLIRKTHIKITKACSRRICVVIELLSSILIIRDMEKNILWVLYLTRWTRSGKYQIALDNFAYGNNVANVTDIEF